MQGKDTQIFGNKTLGNLLEEIYNNSISTRKDIQDSIKELSQFLKSPQEVAIMAPFLKDFVDVGIKNDDQLIKIATIVQRLLSAEAASKGTSGDLNDILSEEEKEHLMKTALKELDTNAQQVKQEVETLKDIIGTP